MRSLTFILLALCASAISCSRPPDKPERSVPDHRSSAPASGERNPNLPTILEGTVTDVTDGDSIIVQVDRIWEVYKQVEGEQTQGTSPPRPLEPSKTFLVDLLGIDAPELDQPWGEEAKQTLVDKVQGKRVMVWIPEIHPVKQTVGWVGAVTSESAQGISETYQTENINFAMVGEGLALRDLQSAANNTALAETEQDARESGRGLWASAKPISP